jgi:ATP-dependent helicase/nuclease subunit A
MGRGLGAGFAYPDVVVGRLPGPVGDPSGARFGMRVPVAAADPLRLWELVDLCEAEAEAEAEEALRLVYVAASRAQERLILSGRCRLPADRAPESLRGSHTALQLLLPALHAREWSGRDGEVALPRAPAVDGGDSGGPEPRVEIRIQRASPERAAELRARRGAGAAPPQDPIEPREPLLPEAPHRAGAGHLSYSALARYADCGYRFYAERVLGLASPVDGATRNGEPSATDEAEGDELLAPELGPRERSLAVGNAVHSLLEAAARQSWDAVPAADLERVLGREGLAGDPDAAERVANLVDGWLRSGVRSELVQSGARLRPEVPFLLELGGAIVRGKIDLLADTPGGPLVVDYKTDAVESADPAELAGRYETQRDLYALAVHGASGGSDPVRAAYCFLEAPDRTVLERYDDDAIRAARGRLEGLVRRIREGDFARTDFPHRSLCHGCPAAARLCGAPAWKPRWA